MQNTVIDPRKNLLSKLILPLILLSTSFLLIASNTDVYEYKLTGALFEIAWLPMLLLIFGLPLVAVWFWHKQGYKLRSNYLVCLVLSAVPLVLLFTN